MTVNRKGNDAGLATGVAAEEPDLGINSAALRRLADAWPRRATVRGDLDGLHEPGHYDPARPDYPTEMVPFWNHPGFDATTSTQRQQVLTLAWLVYNERVIAAEEHVANPAFTLVMHGTFPGAEHPAMRQAVQQALIDEHFHTYMHMLALGRTRELRDVPSTLHFPDTVTYRRFQAQQAATAEKWERHLLSLVWTLVSEVSINAFLSLLSRNDVVQPLHKTVTAWHARDESAHSSLMVEVAKSLYVHMPAEQRRSFVDTLPVALSAFAAQDYSSWYAVLEHVGIPGARDIVGDCERDTASSNLVRDFSGVHRLTEELGVLDQVVERFPALASSRRPSGAATG